MTIRLVRQTTIAAFTLSMIAQARSEILELDCSNSQGVYYNIWVDLSRSSVSIHYANPELPQGLRTFPARITSGSISWSFGGSPKVTLNASIDRTTGLYVQTYGGEARGSTTFQCERGTARYPGSGF
jgi:hypothetical protein